VLGRAPLYCCQISVESFSQGDGRIKRSRFSDEHIIGILKEQEAGAVTADVCRRHGISEATFYKWKAKFGGLEVTEAKRLRTLEEENAKLKKLLAEAMLDIAVLKDISSKKW
jgi:putative transposase